MQVFADQLQTFLPLANHLDGNTVENPGSPSSKKYN